MISYEIPNEIRQGANVALTEAFARGENPHRMMTNGNGEPMVFYMYPFLHSLIGAGIVKLTSLPATLVLLGLNFLYITATAVLISRITYCYTKEPYTVILDYIGCTALFGIVSAGIIYMCMPLYFVETLLLVGNSADNSVWWSITQFIKIGKLFFPWFFVILIWFWRDRRKKEKWILCGSISLV